MPTPAGKSVILKLPNNKSLAITGKKDTTIVIEEPHAVDGSNARDFLNSVRNNGEIQALSFSAEQSMGLLEVFDASNIGLLERVPWNSAPGLQQPSEFVDDQLPQSYQHYDELSELDKYYFNRAQYNFETYWIPSPWYETWIDEQGLGPFNIVDGTTGIGGVAETDDFLELYIFDEDYFKDIPYMNSKDGDDQNILLSVSVENPFHHINYVDDSPDVIPNLYCRNYYNIDDIGNRFTVSLNDRYSPARTEPMGGQVYILSNHKHNKEIGYFDHQKQFIYKDSPYSYNWRVETEFNSNMQLYKDSKSTQIPGYHNFYIYFDTDTIPDKIEICEPNGLQVIKKISTIPGQKYYQETIQTDYSWYQLNFINTQLKFGKEHERQSFSQTTHLDRRIYGPPLMQKMNIVNDDDQFITIDFNNLDDFFIASKSPHQLDLTAINEEGYPFWEDTKSTWANNSTLLYFLHVKEFHDEILISNQRILLNGYLDTSGGYQLLELTGGYEQFGPDGAKGTWNSSTNTLAGTKYRRVSTRGSGMSRINFRLSKVSLAAEFGYRYGVDGAWVENPNFLPLHVDHLGLIPRKVKRIRYPWYEHHPAVMAGEEAPDLIDQQSALQNINRYAMSSDTFDLIREFEDTPALTYDDEIIVTENVKDFYMVSGITDGRLDIKWKPKQRKSSGRDAVNPRVAIHDDGFKRREYELVTIDKLFLMKYVTMNIHLSDYLKQTGSYGIVTVRCPPNNSSSGGFHHSLGQQIPANEILIGKFAITEKDIYIADWLSPTIFRWHHYLHLLESQEDVTNSYGLPEYWPDTRIEYVIKIFGWKESEGNPSVDNWYMPTNYVIAAKEFHVGIPTELVYDVDSMPNTTPEGWMSDEEIAQKEAEEYQDMVDALNNSQWYQQLTSKLAETANLVGASTDQYSDNDEDNDDNDDNNSSTNNENDDDDEESEEDDNQSVSW
tara:strand:- start:363 stop:3209 length:2847 start_codon:yes stop_codon:yes gene_type:complete